MRKIKNIDWQNIEYQKAWNKQEEIFCAQIEKKKNRVATENTLIFCEHPHVYTIGKSGNEGNMLVNDGSVPVLHTNRGGDITYHGQGQIVGYPIFDLENLEVGLKEFIFKIEEAIVEVLKTYSIYGERLQGATGVWLDADSVVKSRKICAIGVRSSRFVTMHGFALNVNTDLSYFNRINPCGFTNRGVTSMQKELGRVIDQEIVKQQLFEAIKRNFL
ncbi:MAG: lipoyl(octanoyl) transferase LipB [Prevotellaceae bacterium]|jgi:lipoyl(octanoyl) transferase|nr:lipoyl(octanoyl) transferase LipB [Prevotellaceae bacterium]